MANCQNEHVSVIMLTYIEPITEKALVDLSVIYCIVWAYVREDNPRALAIGLSPVHTHIHTINSLNAPACKCTVYIIRYLM